MHLLKRQMQMIYLIKNDHQRLKRSTYNTFSFFQAYVESTEIENIPLNRRGWSACSQHLLSIGKFDNWRQRGRSALFISLSALDRSLLGSGSRSLTKIYSRKLCVTHGFHALAGEAMGLATSMGSAKILCAFGKARRKYNGAGKFLQKCSDAFHCGFIKFYYHLIHIILYICNILFSIWIHLLFFRFRGKTYAHFYIWNNLLTNLFYINRMLIIVNANSRIVSIST